MDEIYRNCEQHYGIEPRCLSQNGYGLEEKAFVVFKGKYSLCSKKSIRCARRRAIARPKIFDENRKISNG